MMNQQNNTHRILAKRLLRKYFGEIAKGCKRLDSDNFSEINDIVDQIIDAAIDVAREEFQSTTEDFETTLEERLAIMRRHPGAFKDEPSFGSGI
jgi:hypothetical protein